MKTDPQIRSGCTEAFAELCALSTTASLTIEEYARLEIHLSTCEKCRTLLVEYQSLASEGMAKIATAASILGSGTTKDSLQNSKSNEEDVNEVFADWKQGDARNQLLERLRSGEGDTGEAQARNVSAESRRDTNRIASSRRTSTRVLGVAAVLMFGLLGGYELGQRRSWSRKPPIDESADGQHLRAVETERDALSAELAANSKTIADLNGRAKKNEESLAQLQILKDSLEGRVQQLGATTESLSSVSSERDALRRELEESEHSLKAVKDDLNTIQEERRMTLLRTASLQTTVNELSARLREQDDTVRRDEEFLASDRDVRELMGARQLYIADVFDVDQGGNKRRPFGRVFYTKGKSLIFYAFDLDQQPAYRDAKARDSKAFQVWGSPKSEDAKPVSLGVFYMDSDANRRWVFKSNDPEVLARIDAVFVTVEPKTEHKNPSGKPFLYAYLRAAPANHP
jgi:myosin heavy subunit